MCGIVGFLSQNSIGNMATVVSEMTDLIAHRGPDDKGVWVDNRVGIALGHRRLSILDLSSAGHQPMASHDERLIIIYNGEIYNFAEVRAELEVAAGQINWRGHSDTEILLEAIRFWGLAKTLPKLNGMFALALWDRREKKLFLARDRFGEKPLYYGWANKTFLFGSELKALRKHPHWKGNVKRQALGQLLRKGYISAPNSIVEGINKLPPAHWLEIKLEDEVLPTPQCYWDFTEMVGECFATPLQGSPEELADQLEQVLSKAVGIRMVADVPVGAFLSGGYDSSLISALMNHHSRRPVRTFSIGFEEEQYNEAPYAKQVAEHLGTNHTELYMTGRDALDVVPYLPEIWDEPFGDSSQIPTYLISKLTREHVTVGLSGDAADELFGGYNRYKSTPVSWNKMASVHQGLRQFAGIGARGLSAGLQLMGNSVGGESGRRLSHHAGRIERFSDIVAMPSAMDFYDYKTSHWKRLDGVVRGVGTEWVDDFPKLKNGSISDQLMHRDMFDYLPDDILAKVDRASMAPSLESRIPFLDPAVVKFAWRLPANMKISNSNGKWLLRQVLHRHVPASMVDRPKQGFAVPIEHWLRGPLKDWAENLLDPIRLEQEGFFSPGPIRKMWKYHTDGKRKFHKPLWDILMFQAWLEKYQ